MQVQTKMTNILRKNKKKSLVSKLFSVCCVSVTCPQCVPCVCYRHAQALAALQAYSHWLAQFYSEVHGQNQSQFINLITSTVNASSPLITAKVMPR